MSNKYFQKGGISESVTPALGLTQVKNVKEEAPLSSEIREQIKKEQTSVEQIMTEQIQQQTKNLEVQKKFCFNATKESTPKVAEPSIFNQDLTNLSKISSTLPPGATIVPNLQTYSRGLIAEKNQIGNPSQASGISHLQDKLLLKNQFLDKQRIITWDKAVVYALKIKSGTTGCKGLVEMSNKFEILKTNSIQSIKAGKFKQNKVPLLILEVQSVD